MGSPNGQDHLRDLVLLLARQAARELFNRKALDDEGEIPIE